MKRSHTEVTEPLAIYGQCFRINKTSSPSKFFSELHQRNIHFKNTVIGEIVQVYRCKSAEDRCYNECNLVNVGCLHRRGVFSHVPVDCIDVNNPLKYQCFLCDNSDLGNHFENARLHLIECHPSECWPGWITPENDAKPKPNYITLLKRLLIDQYISRNEIAKKYDLDHLRNITEKENERFKDTKKYKLNALFKNALLRHSSIPSTGGVNPGTVSTPNVDESYSHECPRPNMSLSNSGQCFHITHHAEGLVNPKMHLFWIPQSM
jgi:hypothetical protein